MRWSFKQSCSTKYWVFPCQRYADPSPPPLKKSLFDFLVQIFEKRSETNEKRKKKIPDFFISNYRENSSKITHNLNTKMTITRKIEIGKIL